MSTNKELMQRRSNAVPRGVGQIHPIFAERAENCRVWDVECSSSKPTRPIRQEKRRFCGARITIRFQQQ